MADRKREDAEAWRQEQLEALDRRLLDLPPLGDRPEIKDDPWEPLPHLHGPRSPNMPTHLELQRRHEEWGRFINDAASEIADAPIPQAGPDDQRLVAEAEEAWRRFQHSDLASDPNAVADAGDAVMRDLHERGEEITAEKLVRGTASAMRSKRHPRDDNEGRTTGLDVGRGGSGGGSPATPKRARGMLEELGDIQRSLGIY